MPENRGPRTLARKARRLLRFVADWSAGRGEKPYMLEVLIASRCNARCRMCNVWKLPGHRPGMTDDEMPLGVLERVAGEAAALGTRTVTFSGGEPLLRDDIFEAIRAFKREGIAAMVFTNGVRLANPNVAAALVDSGVDTVVVSLDSPAAAFHDDIRGVNGMWDKATRGVREIAASRADRGRSLQLKLFSLVCSVNAEEAPDMRVLAAELGADGVIYNPLINKVQGALDGYLLTTEDVAAVRARGVDMGPHGEEGFYTRNLCFAPFGQMTLDPFGTAYPCCFACTFQNLGDDLESSYWGEADIYGLGNVKETSLADIWNGRAFMGFRRSMRGVSAHTMCAQCNQPAAEPWTKLQPIFRAVGAVARLTGG